MASPFKRGALLNMEDRRESRGNEHDAMDAPVETLSFFDARMAPAHTKQAKPALTPAILESTRERPSDAALDMLSQTSIPAPPSDQGKMVFDDQAQLDEAIVEHEAAAAPPTFGELFKQARESGKAKFTYNGKRFITRQRHESDSDWEVALKDNKSPMLTDFVAGFERERDVADLTASLVADNQLLDVKNTRTAPTFKQIETMLAPVETKLLPGPEDLDVKSTRTAPTFKMLEAMKAPVTTATKGMFSEAMHNHNVTLAKGKNVDVDKIDVKMAPALEVVSPIFEEAGIASEITSGDRDKGVWSLHENGNAIDMRLKHANPAAMEKLKAGLGGPGIPVKIHGKNGRLWRKGDFEYIIHGERSNIHLHIERDTPNSKAGLAAHLRSIGAGDKVKKGY